MHVFSAEFGFDSADLEAEFHKEVSGISNGLL
jgi:hypothetical protein